MKENIFSINKDIDKDIRVKLNDFYQALFPGLIKIEEVEKGSERDKEGIDIVLHLMEGKEITIQEKIRRDNYNDLLVEFWHSQHAKTQSPEGENRVGWYFKITAELLSYIVPKRLYLFWVKDLKNFVENNQKLLAERSWKIAYNKEGDYWTYNKIIRWDEIPHKNYQFK